jgi:isocitrate/isopropylmalate dehydrogenase
MIEKKVAVLAGDGIGPEIMKEAIKVLGEISKIYNVNIYIHPRRCWWRCNR